MKFTILRPILFSLVLVPPIVSAGASISMAGQKKVSGNMSMTPRLPRRQRQS